MSQENIINIKWQQKIKNKEIMKRTGTDINIMQRMIERKMNFFGHICTDVYVDE